jgi:tetratricopeptide (TPR) repeat protein
VGFYGLVYGIVTYQHAKRATDETVKPNMMWIWITSILGWLIAILIWVQLINLVQSPTFQEKFKAMTEQMAASQTATKKMTAVNKVTGSTEQEKIEAWQTEMKPEAKPYWEHSNELFKQMKEATTLAGVKKLNDENIVTLKKALEIDDQNPEIWSNLASAYTWASSTTGTGDKALAASEKAEELDPTIWNYALNTGDLLNTMPLF